MRALMLLAFLCAVVPAWPESGGVVEGRIEIGPVKPPAMARGYKTRTKNPIEPPELPRAVVYLEPEDGVYPELPAPPVVSVGQEGYQFRPGVVAVRTGTQVAFPNRDDEFHNVFSYSPAKRFDLGRFRKDEESPLITFDQPGLVKVYCEIHPHMRNLLVVVDTPWFTTTDRDGRFSIANVPPGDYQLTAFLPSEDTLRSQVTVQEGRKVEVTLGR